MMPSSSTTATATVAASSMISMMDLGALSGVEAHASGSCIANAAACLCTAKHLLRMIDAPDAVGHWHGAMDFHERPFACFKDAYAIAKKTTKTTRGDDNEEDALVNMSQATRLGLKRALHEDVKAILNTARDEARAPKSLNGVPLPTDPAECLQSVDAMALKTEAQVAVLQAQVAALQACVTQLHEVRFSAERMVKNNDAAAAAARDVCDAAFTATPPPTAKEEQAANNKKKRAKRAP